MPAIFSSPEFAETLLVPKQSDSAARPSVVKRLRMDVFYDDGFFELYLIDREYVGGTPARDVQLTSHGVFTSLMDALAAIDDFVGSYRRQQFADRLEGLRNAFSTLAADPAAAHFDFPPDFLMGEVPKYAVG